MRTVAFSTEAERASGSNGGTDAGLPGEAAFGPLAKAGAVVLRAFAYLLAPPARHLLHFRNPLFSFTL